MVANDTIVRMHEMQLYNSYAEAIIGPIVFPLLFAIIGQMIIYGDLLCQRFTKGRRTLLHKSACGVCASSAMASPIPHQPLIEVIVFLILLCETIFGLFCIIQCSLNYANEAYVGLARACGIQGVYAGYYVFAGPSLTAFCAAVSVSVLVSPGRMASQRAVWSVLAAGLVIHALSLILAALPLLGTSLTYMFAVDFCLPNVETPAYGVLAIAWFAVWLLVLIASAVTACRHKEVKRAARWLVVGLVPYTIITWSWLLMIAGASLAQGAVVSRSWGNALYAPLALFLHTNQLVVPLYFGWLLRSHMYAAVTPRLPLKLSAPPIMGNQPLTSLGSTPSQDAAMHASPLPSPPASECGEQDPDHAASTVKTTKAKAKRNAVAPYIV